METPAGYERDVRFPDGQIPRYDRNEVIAIITDFCNFFNTLPVIQPGQLLFPPEGGWPNITRESMAPLGKTEDVVELLKRLPYFDTTSDQTRTRSGKCFSPRKSCCTIKPDTSMYDFQSEPYHAALRRNDLENCIPPFLDLPPWAICLKTGYAKAGDYLILDTSDGTITNYDFPGCSFDLTYPAEDPRHWRDKCADSTHTAKQYFDNLAIEWKRLRIIAYPTSHSDSMAVHYTQFLKQEEAYKLKRIWHWYGWPEPDDFRQDECRQALIKWYHERH